MQDDGILLWTLEPTHLAMQVLVVHPAAAAHSFTALAVEADSTVLAGTATGAVWHFSLVDGRAGPAEQCAQMDCASGHRDVSAITRLQVHSRRFC